MAVLGWKSPFSWSRWVLVSDHAQTIRLTSVPPLTPSSAVCDTHRLSLMLLYLLNAVCSCRFKRPLLCHGGSPLFGVVREVFFVKGNWLCLGNTTKLISELFRFPNVREKLSRNTFWKLNHTEVDVFHMEYFLSRCTNISQRCFLFALDQVAYKRLRGNVTDYVIYTLIGFLYLNFIMVKLNSHPWTKWLEK